jgi:type IV secretory pathway VirJ component
MKRRTTLLAVLLAVALAGGIIVLGVRRLPRAIEMPELGRVHVYPAWLGQRGFAFVFAGADGWRDVDAAAARSLARAGYRVVGIDTTQFLDAQAPDSGCLYLPGILEEVSRTQQRRAGVREYQEPALFGRGAGATLVYMAQLQAPPLAFAAAVALSPTPQLALRVDFCDHPGTRMGTRLLAVQPEPPGPNVPLRLWTDAGAAEATLAFVRRVIADRLAFAPRTSALPEAYRAALEDITVERQRSPVADLPLVEVQPQQPSNPAFAILYSGDGGWRDLDQTLAGVLADKGMPVVGVDVLRYCWHDKAPQAAADDLARIMRYYGSAWHRDRVVLIGYSFGADVLPFLFNRLPRELRARVQLISLLSPERETAFAIEPTAWLGIETSGGKVPIEPELRALPADLVQCVYGADEHDDSLCTLPAAAAMHVLRKPGGHHFDENYDRLAEDVLTAASGS